MYERSRGGKEEGKKCEDLIGVPSSFSLSPLMMEETREMSNKYPSKRLLYPSSGRIIQAFFLITYLLPLASLRKQGSRSKII